MANYLDIVDDVIAEIRAGRLRAGDRLPPQRDFAYRRGIAASTAARVYGELVRRGVAAGEVGRGTFVRLMPTPARPALAEPTPLTVDLDLNFPTVPEQDALLAASLAQLAQRADARAQAFAPASARGSAALRGIAATFLARPGWTPDPDSLLFAGSGKQAIAATLSALVSTGDRLGVEALTYPFVKDIARQLGIRLVPLALDGEGLMPEAVVAQQRQAPLKALYLQPTLHNPLGVSMSRERRARLAAVLRAENLLAVEDGIYAFLDDRLPPLKALAPERVALVDSLSKRLSPGLTVGFVMPPADAREAIVRALHTGAWVAPAFAQAAAGRWMADGTAARIVAAKRLAAAERQALAARRLAGFALAGDPHAFHGWLSLPEPWRAESFVAAAARRGIAVTPASAFAVMPGHGPNAVRLALSVAATDRLDAALAELAAILREGPDAGIGH